MRVLTEQEIDYACELAANAATYANIALALNFPSLWSFYRHRAKDPILAQALKAAREDACDTLEDSMITAIKDHDSPHAARVYGDMCALVLRFRKPERYGQKLDLNITQAPDIGSSIGRMQQALDAVYRDVTPALEAPKSNDFNDLW